jgi:aminopeptidase N
MENAGAVTFTETYVFRSKVTDAVKERRDVTILNELANMWIGDLFTMKWRNDLWLNESFAEWASTIATAEANPGIVPRSVNLTTLRSRADTLDRLGEVKRTLTQLLERVEDTEIRLASEVYATARSVYSVMKTPATVPGLNEQKALLSRRFAKKGKRRPNEETTAVKASG